MYLLHTCTFWYLDHIRSSFSTHAVLCSWQQLALERSIATHHQVPPAYMKNASILGCVYAGESRYITTAGYVVAEP